MALGLGGEREMIARQRHLDRVADPQFVVDAPRGLAELLPQHRDAVAPPLGRVVPQRIVAPQIVAEPHADMRPGLEARQIAPVRIDQLVAVDILGEIGDRAQPQAHICVPFSEAGRLCDLEALPVLDAPHPGAQARMLGERRLALGHAGQIVQQRGDHQIGQADPLAGHEGLLAHQPRELGQAQPGLRQRLGDRGFVHRQPEPRRQQMRLNTIPAAIARQA